MGIKPEAPASLEKYQNETYGDWYCDPKIISFIKEQKEKDISFDLIRADIIKKFDRVIRSADYLRKKYTQIQSDKEYFDRILKSKDIYVRTYRDAYEDFEKFIDRVKIKKQNNKTTKGKVLVFGDSHSPFYNKELLAFLIKTHGDAETLIHAGDIFDCYSVSSFDKELDISLKEEMIDNTLFVDLIAKTWNNIKIMKGNHNDRVGRYFRKRIEPGMMFLVQDDILSMVCKPHKNIEIISDKYEFENGMGKTIIGHFCKHGKDLVIGHFENAKKEPVKTVQECYNHISGWESYFKLEPIRLFLQAHTHSIGKWYRKGGSLVVGETGCTCQIQGYQTKPKIGWEPNTPGYWIIYQINGKTDLNESRPFVYGEW